MTLYVEITKGGYLSIPKRIVEKMRLKAGMRFKLLADEDDVLVLRLVRENETQVDEGSLLLQQEALKNIWDSEEEDAYELWSWWCRYRPISICDLRRGITEGTASVDYIMTVPRRLVARRLGQTFT